MLGLADDLLWSYIGFPLILFIGLWFSLKTRFIQIRKFPHIVKFFVGLMRAPESKDGVHPLKVFFACVGGCVGIGNIVGICTAVQFGGPGALFWVWITAILGSMVKYSEVFLGVKFRIQDGAGGYLGGPMYFLQKVCKTMWLPNLVCIFLAIYGVEIFQFSVITSSVSANFGFDKLAVTLVLLALVMWAGCGGVRRVGNISTVMIPLFVLIYLSMGVYVIMLNIERIPSLLQTVFSSAFTGHAAFGGFIGAGLMTTISQGIRRGCYSGDLGVGYASVIHSETSLHSPSKQASLTIFDLFLDTFIICSSSIMIVLITGVWSQGVDSAMLVQVALSEYFPYMNIFMPFLLFLLGYSTINAYFIVGIKSAEFLSPTWGKKIYFGYAVVSLFIFSFVELYEAQVIMALVNCMLLMINGWAVWRLRSEIAFDFADEKAVAVTN